MHIPHIGETVLVHHKDCFSNGAQTVPAIVVQTFETAPGQPNLINLTAFPPFRTPQFLGSVPWFTSTPLIPDETFTGCWPRNTHHAHVGEPDTSNDPA